MKENWKSFINKKNSKIIIILSLILLAAALFSISKFIVFVEARDGVVLDDPLFHFYKAIDLNYVIFALIYVSLILALLLLLKYPAELFIAIQSYSLMVFIRIAAMYLVPLNQHPDAIDLQDPIVFLIGTGQKVTKDLFFSGHTSTLFLMFLTAKNKIFKYIFLTSSVLVGTFVVLQKVHYAIDVFAAFFFAYASYRAIIILNKKLNKTQTNEQ